MQFIKMKVKSDHRSKFSNLSNDIGRKKPEKCQGKFIAMITFHFHLQSQYNMNFIYIFHIISLHGKI